MHKFIVEDSTKCFTAMPDYILIFTKSGENQVRHASSRFQTIFWGHTGLAEHSASLHNANENTL